MATVTQCHSLCSLLNLTADSHSGGLYTTLLTTKSDPSTNNTTDRSVHTLGIILVLKMWSDETGRAGRIDRAQTFRAEVQEVDSWTSQNKDLRN